MNMKLLYQMDTFIQKQVLISEYDMVYEKMWILNEYLGIDYLKTHQNIT